MTAALSHTAEQQGKCAMRACPFPSAPDAELCPYHSNFFSYESSLFDRSIEDRYRDEEQFTADGLVIHQRKKSSMTRDDRIAALYHQILASAGMLADALKYLGQAPPSQLTDWSTNHFAAQELLELSRYPGKQIICAYCGWRDILRYPRGFSLIYRCRLCDRQWSLTARTILHRRGLTLDKWVHALRILKDNRHRGVMTELAEKLQISPDAAVRLNHKFRLCGETLGLELGCVGLRNSTIRDSLRRKLGLPVANARPPHPPTLMTIAEVAAHFNRDIDCARSWVRRGKLQIVRFRNLRLIRREQVLAFQPPREQAL